VIVLDNFLPDSLTDYVEPFKGIQWWDGVTKQAPAHDIVAFCRNHFELRGLCGFEYWYNEGNNNQWHVDRDEGYEHLVPADWSCVLYPTQHSLWGGFLEIQGADETRTEVERIAPRFNRCVVLDPGAWHRVSKIWSGQRHAFIINGWVEPPSTAS
jgi:hypothetical protein